MVRRSREDAATTRARILASAQQLIRQRGPHGVTLEDVARAIGMTRGAVYAHFRSRAELLGALLLCAEADFTSRLATLSPPLSQSRSTTAAAGALERSLAALLDGDDIARHASLISFLLQHKCGAACELCPLRARLLQGIDTLRDALAALLPEPAMAGLLVAHLWGLLSAHALQLAPSGLPGCASALARLYAGAGMQPDATAVPAPIYRPDTVGDPARLRDTP